MRDERITLQVCCNTTAALMKMVDYNLSVKTNVNNYILHWNHEHKDKTLQMFSQRICYSCYNLRVFFFELHICFGTNNVKFSLYSLGRTDYILPIQNSFMYPTIPKMAMHKQ